MAEPCTARSGRDRQGDGAAPIPIGVDPDGATALVGDGPAGRYGDASRLHQIGVQTLEARDFLFQTWRAPAQAVW